MAIAADECLGAWRRQVDLGGAQGWCGRVDFLHEALPVVVEVQSERYHTALLDVAADAARRARLEAAGFLVVEVWDSQLWYARHEVVTRVREGLRAARSGSLIGTRA
jgi:very-short-patch-repair endonuclease